MNFQAVEANNGNLVDMFGTFMEIGGVQYTQNQKAKAICKIVDDNGVSHKVHLHQGSGELPQPAQLQQRHAFSISTFQGNYQGTPYTGYSGFWNNKAQVNQQPRQALPQPQQGPQPPRQSTKAPDWDAIAEGKVRHGLVCANIESGGILTLAELEDWKTYIMTGHHPNNVPVPDQSITEEPQQYAADGTPIDDSIPF